jgi:uncharacterized protein (TIGR02266 family)
MPSAAFQSDERRQRRRLPIRIEVNYQTLDEFLQDFSANLSIGGIFIQTDEPLTEGTRFRLEFTLPGDERAISAVGVVCWVAAPEQVRGNRVPGMGISFAELSRTDHNRITRWLDARSLTHP